MSATNRLSLAQPAVRAGQKARVALIGPSGAGKTWTSLVIATELAAGGKILLIDTEEGSGALYADKFQYDHLRWNPPYDPRELTVTVDDAGKNYAVVILDSASHFWENEGGLLDIVDSVAARSSSKNTFAAWKEGTPIQQDMVRSFLRCGGHVIVTMRAKTEYVLEQDERGRTSPKRVGLAPVQRAGMEYEFTVIGLLELNHQLVIDKSRCDDVADKRYLKGKAGEFARTLATWLAGAAPEKIAPSREEPQGTGAEPPTTQTSRASSSAPPPVPAAPPVGIGAPEIVRLLGLAANLPRPIEANTINDLLKKHSAADLIDRMEKAHKMQCGSACPHLAAA